MGADNQAGVPFHVKRPSLQVLSSDGSEVLDAKCHACGLGWEVRQWPRSTELSVNPEDGPKETR